MNDPYPRKSLGQHWLTDEAALLAIADAADIKPIDTVVEIGPGLGTLTLLLAKRARRVVAVELDTQLAAQLPKRVPADNLTIFQQDILHFDFTALEPGYKVVANIPYYLTSNLIRVLSETTNPPAGAVLLVQQEVAERVAAEPGDMSLLSVTAQWYWEVSLGVKVPARLFTPPPKVDSQVLILRRRPHSLFPNVDVRGYFRIVKAGFSQRRKTLLNSLSAGLQLSRQDTLGALERCSVDPQTRAQALSLEAWYKLYKSLTR